MSPADMEANLSQYRMFQEKKKRVGLTFFLFVHLKFVTISIFRFRKKEDPFPQSTSFAWTPNFPLF